MAFETLKASITLLMEEIEKSPDDVHVLQEELREKISELKTMGLPVPEDILALEKALGDDDAEEMFDNVPL